MRRQKPEWLHYLLERHRAPRPVLAMAARSREEEEEEEEEQEEEALRICHQLQTQSTEEYSPLRRCSSRSP